jgi:hypothetical protein
MSLALTPENRANVVVTQSLGQLINVATQLKNAIANGLPAQGNQPAATADEITAALGANLTTVQAVITASGV